MVCIASDLSSLDGQRKCEQRHTSNNNTTEQCWSLYGIVEIWCKNRWPIEIKHENLFDFAAYRQNKYLFQKFSLRIEVKQSRRIVPQTHTQRHIHTQACRQPNECVSSTVAFHTTRLDFYIIIKSSFHSVYFESRTLVLLRLALGLPERSFFSSSCGRSGARQFSNASLSPCTNTSSAYRGYIMMCIHVEIMIIYYCCDVCL